MDSSSNNDFVEKCFGPLLKNESLQYIQKELGCNEDNIGLLIIKHSSLSELYSKNECFRIDEQCKMLDKMFNLNLTYNSVLFVIVFCPVKEFNKIFSKFPLKAHPLDYGKFLWGCTKNDNEFIESLKTFLYPVSIKPAKRS
jgi:hypothetical protein